MGANLSKAMGTTTVSLLIFPCSNHIRSPGKIFGNKEMRLLMLGLDAAGKTSAVTRTTILSVSAHLLSFFQQYSTS